MSKIAALLGDYLNHGDDHWKGGCLAVSRNTNGSPNLLNLKCVVCFVVVHFNMRFLCERFQSIVGCFIFNSMKCFL